MLKHRLIAVVIVRDGQVVQSVNFKHTNVIHYDAIHAIESFNRWCVDEIALINVSKSAESKSQFLDVVTHVSKKCFVPLTVGGWIDDFNYGKELLSKGADKLLLNSAFYLNQELIRELVQTFGSQAVVASVDVVNENGTSLVAIDRATRTLPFTVKAWAKHCCELGAGEIFFNSVAFDGARKGYDLVNLKGVCDEVKIPVIAFGGAFRWKHFVEGFQAGADAVAAANIFHYTEHSTKHAKRHIFKEGINIRMEGIS